MDNVAIPIRIAVLSLVLIAAVYDFRFRRIPNWLNASGLVLGFGLNLLFSQWHGLAVAGEGLLLAAAIYLPFYLLRGMGAGDVKLMAAIGSLVGPWPWFQIFLATAILGGVAAVLLALCKKRFTETCINMYALLHDFLRLRAPYKTNSQVDVRNAEALRMPHAVIIGLGTLVVLSIPISPLRLS
ncbi:MAG TPA: A24 family peptidase [Bryobacteraceae bacterium]|nr:A24 family peptidase [Bryobacteraceae bacterium]